MIPVSHESYDGKKQRTTNPPTQSVYMSDNNKAKNVTKCIDLISKKNPNISQPIMYDTNIYRSKVRRTNVPNIYHINSHTILLPYEPKNNNNLSDIIRKRLA